MTQKAMPYKEFDESDCDQYISENCRICQIELTNIKEIFIDIEKDTYICLDCMKYYNIKAAKCN